MSGTRRFWKGILFGAICGGAIALLDKETRKSVIDGCKNGTKELSYYVRHPHEAAEKVKDKTESIRNTVEQVSEDLSYIVEKVGELKETTPAVAGIVKETKEAFSDKE